MNKQFFFSATSALAKSVIIIMMIFAVTGCDLDTTGQEDERDPIELLEEVLPIGQSNLIYWQMDRMNRYTSIWMQHLGGIRSMEERVDRYNIDHVHHDEIWSDFYNYIYPYFESIISNGEKAGSPAYQGIGRVMKAYAFTVMTDAFGDIPMTQALNYYDATQMPVYDPQDVIIMQLISELEQATSDLYRAMETGGSVPGEKEDHIYGGDLQQWIRAANTQRLRLMLRFAHHDDSYEQLQNEFAGVDLFTGNNDNMLYRFPDMRNNPNPVHEYNQRIRNVRVGKALVEKLKSVNDPRLPRLVRLNTNNNHVGSGPGESNHNASYHGNAVGNQNSPYPMITYAEMKFIQAEVFYRSGQQTQADQAFYEGVMASLDYFGVMGEDPEWEAEFADIENVTLQQIIEAKYVALAYTPEVWADYRRTGYPELTPYENASDKIPRRMLYPQDELTYNTENVPSGITLYDRVWWDVIDK